jgi:hypothetical protein
LLGFSRLTRAAVASQYKKDVVCLKRSPWKIRNAFAGILLASFSRGVQMKILVTAAILSAFAFSPASAAMMACTSDNMAKSAAMMVSMPDTPGKMAANKEMSMANTDMSMGKMKSACMHYMSAQKASMAK